MKFIKYVETESYGRKYQSPRPGNLMYLTAGAFLFVTLGLSFCFRSIDASQVGLVTRFGAIEREVGEGPMFKWPWENLHKFNVKTAKEEVKTQAGTKDAQIINSQIAVNYHIERGNAGKVYSQLGDKYLETVLMPRVQTLFKNQTPAYVWNELLPNRSKIEANTLLAIQSEFDKQGIKVEQFSVIDFGFSPEITAAIEQKQVAQQEAEKAVYVAQKAQQEAQADIERARGQAEAQRLLTSTASNQSIELKRLEVQQAAIAKWNGQLPTTSLGSDSNILFNLKP